MRSYCLMLFSNAMKRKMNITRRIVSEQILAMTIVVSLVASDFEFCVYGIVLFNQFDFMFINLIKYQVCSLSRYEVALLEANFSMKKRNFNEWAKEKMLSPKCRSLLRICWQNIHLAGHKSIDWYILCSTLVHQLVLVEFLQHIRYTWIQRCFYRNVIFSIGS